MRHNHILKWSSAHISIAHQPFRFACCSFCRPLQVFSPLSCLTVPLCSLFPSHTGTVLLKLARSNTAEFFIPVHAALTLTVPPHDSHPLSSFRAALSFCSVSKLDPLPSYCQPFASLRVSSRLCCACAHRTIFRVLVCPLARSVRLFCRSISAQDLFSRHRHALSPLCHCSQRVLQSCFETQYKFCTCSTSCWFCLFVAIYRRSGSKEIPKSTEGECSSKMVFLHEGSLSPCQSRDS